MLTPELYTLLNAKADPCTTTEKHSYNIYDQHIP